MLNVVRLGLARAAYSIGMTQIASNGHLISLKWDLQSHKEGIKTNVKSHDDNDELQIGSASSSSRGANPLCESGSSLGWLAGSDTSESSFNLFPRSSSLELSFTAAGNSISCQFCSPAQSTTTIIRTSKRSKVINTFPSCL